MMSDGYIHRAATLKKCRQRFLGAISDDFKRDLQSSVLRFNQSGGEKQHRGLHKKALIQGWKVEQTVDLDFL